MGIVVTAADGAEEAGGVEVFDVAISAVDLVNLDGIGVEAEDPKTLFGKGESEREPDVAETDHGDEGAFFIDLGEELVCEICISHGHSFER
jgi:hypothetical protein